MKLAGTILKYVLGTVVILAIVAGVALQLPRDPRGDYPGKSLIGDVAAWPGDPSFAQQEPYIFIETRPSNPHSVTIISFLYEGELHVISRGKWGEYLEADPRARIKVGDSIYLVSAERRTEPEVDMDDVTEALFEQNAFMRQFTDFATTLRTDRRLFRLTPREG